jgi:filamin
VKVVGDGVKPTGVPASLPVSFTIDIKEAGVADLDVKILVCGPVFYFPFEN